jgi:hypothetical protein
MLVEDYGHRISMYQFLVGFGTDTVDRVKRRSGAT